MTKRKTTFGSRVLRVVPCLHGCTKPVPETIYLRDHPFKTGWEIRRCVHCGRDSAYDARSLHGELPKAQT